jgi:hypothetical protein
MTDFPALLVVACRSRFATARKPGGSWYQFEQALKRDPEKIGASTLGTWRCGARFPSPTHVDALVRVTRYPHAYWLGFGPTQPHACLPARARGGFTAEELVAEWDAYLENQAERDRARLAAVRALYPKRAEEEAEEAETVARLLAEEAGVGAQSVPDSDAISPKRPVRTVEKLEQGRPATRR